MKGDSLLSYIRLNNIVLFGLESWNTHNDIKQINCLQLSTYLDCRYTTSDGKGVQ